MSAATLALDPISTALGAVRALADEVIRPAANADEAEIVDALLKGVRTWGSRSLDCAKTDASASIPKSIYAEAAELGLFGLTVPEEFGGAGLSLMAAGRVTEEIATFDRSVATALGLHNGLGLRGLIRFGSRSLRERYLPDLATGKRIAAFAATEPGAGSHIAGVKTCAKWDGGSRLSVSGEKCYVTNGAVSDVYTILASTPGLGGARKGCSLLVLEKGMPGISVGREEHKLGIRGSSTTTLTFEEVAIGVEQVIGEPSKGLDLIAEVLAWGRTLMSAGCLGTARDAFRRTVEHVVTRQQFNKPIGSFGQVREKIAQMRALLWAMESLVRLTTALQSCHGSNIIWESSIAKVFASEATWRICDDAVQLHGGAGYIEETGVSRLLRDCRITRIFEGANELLRFHVAAGAMGFPATLARAPALSGQVDASLDGPARRFDGLRARLAETFASLRTRYGIRVADHQILLARAADAAIGTFSMLAVLLRTDGELRASSAAGDREQALRLASFSTEMLARGAEEALAAAGRAPEEDLVHGVSDFEYQRVAGRA
jgi:alkylation response protein AidB-like acyl-CoA dehydrogenase